MYAQNGLQVRGQGVRVYMCCRQYIIMHLNVRNATQHHAAAKQWTCIVAIDSHMHLNALNVTTKQRSIQQQSTDGKVNLQQSFCNGLARIGKVGEGHLCVTIRQTVYPAVDPVGL